MSFAWSYSRFCFRVKVRLEEPFDIQNESLFLEHRCCELSYQILAHETCIEYFYFRHSYKLWAYSNKQNNKIPAFMMLTFEWEPEESGNKCFNNFQSKTPIDTSSMAALGHILLIRLRKRIKPYSFFYLNISSKGDPKQIKIILVAQRLLLKIEK